MDDESQHPLVGVHREKLGANWGVRAVRSNPPTAGRGPGRSGPSSSGPCTPARRKRGGERAGRGSRRVRDTRCAGFVSFDHVTHRRTQSRFVERAGEAEHDGNAVGGRASVEPVQEPHTLLCEGQRNMRGRGAADQGRPLDLVRSFREILRQFRDRRVVEQFADADGGSQRRSDAGDGLRRGQRVSARRKEVVVPAHPAGAGDLREHERNHVLGGGWRADRRQTARARFR